MGIKEVFNLARVPSILMLGVIYVTYVLIGGVIFWKLEGDLGQKDISLLLLNKKRLFMKYPCMNQEGLEAVAEVRHRNTLMAQNYVILNLWFLHANIRGDFLSDSCYATITYALGFTLALTL